VICDWWNWGITVNKKTNFLEFTFRSLVDGEVRETAHSPKGRDLMHLSHMWESTYSVNAGDAIKTIAYLKQENITIPSRFEDLVTKFCNAK